MITFPVYLQAFWISSIRSIDAILHWEHCASELSNLCIVLNSSGLALCSIGFISSREWQLPSMLSFGSTINLIPKTLVLTLSIELLEPYVSFMLSMKLPEDARRTLWFQYSTHWWLGSWASIAWKCWSECNRTSGARMIFQGKILKELFKSLLNYIKINSEVD